MSKSLKLSMVALFLVSTPIPAFAQSFYTPYLTRKEISITVAPQPTTAEGLAATGSTITDALPLSASENTVTDVSGGTAIKLPDQPRGDKVIVYNRSSSTVMIFPSSSTDQIESYGAGVGFSLGANGTVEFHRTGENQWRIKP